MPDLIMRGRRFAYLDSGGSGTPVLALHGGSGGPGSTRGLPTSSAPGTGSLRSTSVGHGLSEHGGDFSREAFVADAAEFVNALGLAPSIVFGHSLGGVNAYQLAARHPDLVRALIVQDIGAITGPPVVAEPVLDIKSWPKHTRTRAEFEQFLAGFPAVEYFVDSLVETPDGWRMLYSYDDMMAVQHGNVGDWWADWLGSSCPALLLHGEQSPLLPGPHAQEMAARRPNTELVEFPGCGHWLHDDDPAGFARAVRTFVNDLQRIGKG